MKKKTFEEVRELFENRGFQLLNNEYKGAHSLLDYVCSNDHQTKISFAKLHRGVGCLECSGKKKKTVEEVKNLFESRGYTLLSDTYKNSHSHLEYICSNEHQTQITLKELQNGHGCAECAGLKKKTIEDVRELFASRSYTLLSTEYIGVDSPLKYICTNEHNAKISFAKLQSGRGCLKCSGKNRKTMDEVTLGFNQRGFQLLSTEYKNSHSHLEYLCSQGHQTQISFSSLQIGRGCLECSGKRKKTIKEVRLAFNQRSYTLISTEYKNISSPLKYICNNGHQTKINFKDLQRGIGCASCSNHGFNPNKPAILYYLRFQFESDFYYKIGITNRTILERFQLEKTSYTVIKETPYTLGKDARDKEQAILKQFVKYKYKGQSFLTVGGNTELFNRDVLQLDDSILKAGRM